MEQARVGSKEQLYITQVRDGIIGKFQRRDDIVVEEPLEIRLQYEGQTHKLAITMRTPSSDFELAAGFLFTEGIIQDVRDIRQIAYCVDQDIGEDQRYNVVNVQLANPPQKDLRLLERHFTVNSACGVCGKASIDAIHIEPQPAPSRHFSVSPQLIATLSDKLRAEQKMFDSTGGLHAVGLFDQQGNLIEVREDVGRHNAMDKLIGWALMSKQLPLSKYIILVSGRASFELIQKAAMAQIPIFCAVSAPSNLAIATARRFNMSLIGFLREHDFNIYSGAERIKAND